MFEKLRKGMEFVGYVLVQDLPLKYKEDISEKDGVSTEKCFYCDELEEMVLHYYNDGSKKFNSDVIDGWGFTKREAYSELLRCIELALDRGSMSKKSMKYFRKKKGF